MTIPALNTPPDSRTSYVINQLEGETMSIPGTKSFVRILASSKQTDGAIAVFSLNGVGGDPAGFHYHKEAHDYFLVTKGRLQLWAGDKCRILEVGDFAYVPPVCAKPHVLFRCPITETVGLVTPGDWVDFFRFISDPFDGLIAAEYQTPEQLGQLQSRVMAAKNKYDVHFVGPDYQPPALGDWEDSENVLPGGTQTYFLKSNTGPRWLAGGVLSRPFVTTTQTEGRVAISSIESSSYYKKAILRQKYHTFASVHHCILLQEGTLKIRIKGHGNWSTIQGGETVVIPAGEGFSLDFCSKYVRFICCASGKGLEELIQIAGYGFDGIVLPDAAADLDEQSWVSACATLDILCEGA
ncbi:hypothetical protein FDECE_16332 [Fusarium decemcellulare]|nr:hypothetical protein FDECE_16332 [Fusarium decemcellulare]